MRVLIAGGQGPPLAQLAELVAEAGHQVAAEGEAPDVALVALRESAELALLGRIAGLAACPVVALLAAPDPALAREAARCGIFAAVVGTDGAALQGVLEVARLRYADYSGLEGAFGRRATIERAKGILMERHSIGEREAFELLRAHARRTNTKAVDVARAVTGSHLLLGKPGPHG